MSRSRPKPNPRNSRVYGQTVSARMEVRPEYRPARSFWGVQIDVNRLIYKMQNARKRLEEEWRNFDDNKAKQQPLPSSSSESFYWLVGCAGSSSNTDPLVIESKTRLILITRFPTVYGRLLGFDSIVLQPQSSSFTCSGTPAQCWAYIGDALPGINQSRRGWHSQGDSLPPRVIDTR